MGEGDHGRRAAAGGARKILEDRNLLKLRSLGSLFSILLSDASICVDDGLKCSKCYDRKAKIVIATGRQRGKTPNVREK